MATKKINTDLQLTAKLLDTSGDAGTSNQVLVSTTTGINWVDGSGSGIIGGPYLPIAGGTMTGTLNTQLVAPTANVTYNLGSSTNHWLEAFMYSVRSGGVLQFKTNGDNERMRIDSSGNVLINRTGASGYGKLNVDGGADFTGGNVLLCRDTGNVGIGTDSPVDKLDVNGNLSIYGNKIYNGAASNSAGLDFGGSYANLSGYYGIRFYSSTAGIGSMSERMRITNTGNVGIGETNPLVPLHISRDTASGENIALILDNNNTTAGNEIGMLFRSAVGSTNTDFEIFGKSNAANDMDLVFQSDGSVERVRFTADGKVGIGTDTPTSSTTGDAFLEVQNNGYLQARLSSTASSAGIEFIPSSGNNYEIQANPSGDFFVYDRTNGSYRFLIDSLGNVGIGTTSPDSLLELENSPAAQTQSRMLHIDNNPSSNQGSGYIEISSGSNNQAKTQIEQVSSGGYGLLGNQYIDTNIINRGLSSSPHGNINFATGSSTSATSIVMTIGGGSQKGNVGIGTTSPSSIGTGITTLDIEGSNAGGVAFGVSGTKNYIYGASTMYVQANTTAAFLTGGTEKMRITSGGQLIVGGTTVGYAGTKLQVGNTSDSQNGLNILTSTTGYGYILFGDGAAAATYVGQITYKHGDDYMSFQTNGSEKVRILANGNVGIGQTNPGAKLEISDSLTQPALLLTSDGGNEQFKIRRYSNNNEQLILGFHSSDYAQIQAVEQGVAYRYLVLNPNGGNVGIGITNPGYKLEVSGNAQFEDYIRITNSGGGQRILFGNQDSAGVNNPSVILGANGNTYIGGGNSWTGNGGTIDYTATFLDNGNVGIGTPSPAYGLTVQNNNTINTEFRNSAGDALAIKINTGLITFLSTYEVTGTNMDIAFTPTKSTGTQTEALRIQASSGNVGINETNPGQKLHVNGNARVTGFYYDSTNSAGTPGYVLSSTSGGTAWVTADSVISYKWYAVSDGGLASASISNSTSLDFQGGTGISTSTSGSGSAYTIEFTNTDRGSSQNIFKNIAVSGQPTVVADSNNDTVTFGGNKNISITTNANSDTVYFYPKVLETCNFQPSFKSPTAQTNYLVWINGSYQSTTGPEIYKTALYDGKIDIVKVISDVTVSGVYIDVYETGAPTTPIWSSGSTSLTANTVTSFSPSGATFSANDQLYITLAIPTSATIIYRIDFGLLYD